MSNLLKKDGSLSIAGKESLQALKKVIDSKLRGDLVWDGLKSWEKSKGHWNLKDKSSNAIDALVALKVSFEETNVAPRGGEDGFALLIPTSQRPKIRRALAKFSNQL